MIGGRPPPPPRVAAGGGGGGDFRGGAPPRLATDGTLVRCVPDVESAVAAVAERLGSR